MPDRRNMLDEETVPPFEPPTKDERDHVLHDVLLAWVQHQSSPPIANRAAEVFEMDVRQVRSLIGKYNRAQIDENDLIVMR